MKKRVAILISMLMVVIGAFGLTACSGDDNLYIEVKHPITGEWINSESGDDLLKWDLPYTGESYPLEVRYKYRGNVVDPEKENLAVQGNKMKETPSGIGCYTLHYYAYKPAKGVNTMPFDIRLNIFGEFNVKNNLKVELEKQQIDITAMSFGNNSTKNYKLTVPESGTYRFETMDRDPNRLKYLFLWDIKSGTQNDNDNNIHLEVDLEANKEYTLSTGIKEKYLNSIVFDTDYFEIKITRIA